MIHLSPSPKKGSGGGPGPKIKCLLLLVLERIKKIGGFRTYRRDGEEVLGDPPAEPFQQVS